MDSSSAEPLHDAMQQLTDVVIYDIVSPPQASRVYTYATVAAYEVLRQDHRGYSTLAGQLNELTPVPAPAPDRAYDFALAGVHAFLVVGRALTFSQARMDSVITASHARFRQTGVRADVFARSIAYGDSVAQHILAWAAKDNFKQTRGYPKFSVTSESGRWVPTPPSYMDAVEPNWGTLRPFVMTSSSEVRPKPPLVFDTTAGSPYFREVKEVYDVSKRLSPDRLQVAAFWDDNPYLMHVQGHAMFATKKMSPGGHWMAITGAAAKASGADIMRMSEAYVRVAIAVADGFVSCWAEKYRSNTVRPETVINAHLDEQWEPLLQTPPFPEYTSGHSVISNAAAVVLTDLFGPKLAFSDSSEAAYGLPVRTFTSLEQAAAEAAVSRLYGGIHFRRAIEEGSAQGRSVGWLVISRVKTRAGDVAQHTNAATPEPKRAIGSRL